MAPVRRFILWYRFPASFVKADKLTKFLLHFTMKKDKIFFRFFLSQLSMALVMDRVKNPKLEAAAQGCIKG